MFGGCGSWWLSCFRFSKEANFEHLTVTDGFVSALERQINDKTSYEATRNDCNLLSIISTEDPCSSDDLQSWVACSCPCVLSTNSFGNTDVCASEIRTSIWSGGGMLVTAMKL